MGNLRKEKKNAGFTLVELLVVIFITALMASVVVVNFRSSDNALEFSGANMASIFRKAQVFALSGQEYQGSIPSGGYGIHIEACTVTPCEYRIFADVNGNFLYDGALEDMPDEVYKTDIGIEISGINLGEPIDITFKPPKPFICFRRTSANDCESANELLITLRDAGSTREKVLTVNQVSGQISFQE